MKKQNKKGPKEEKLKIDGNWEDAVEKAVKKEKPEEGWPDDKKDKK